MREPYIHNKNGASDFGIRTEKGENEIKTMGELKGIEIK